ncbi:helix-turn-helix domain-containing protein [Salipaludibacillus sp. HK11]|uniref:helix-turn-helix domain-containing protein n=1 Tax=Salipaludibacillus sp. HK11 TaxID=3394320 RepID=UPI0039FD5AA7
MSDSKVDAVLHPIRMKIIQALARNSMTVQEIGDHLGDVPQATLYRHLNILKKSIIVSVEKETQVRGTLEKRYSLNINNARVSADEAKTISKEEHKRYFMAYFALILKQMEEYMEGEVDYEKDGFGYNQIDLYLTDEENIEFLTDYGALLQKYSQSNHSEARKRTISTVLIPEKKTSQQTNKGSEEND